MNIYMLLFIEFFKIGLFSVGGGYATIPFLYYIAKHYTWFSVKELTDMIAVSNITPGPIGVNMAAYAGFKTAGILGSIIATVAIVIPSFVIVILIIKLLKQFKQNRNIEGVLTGLRPAACAMITAVGIKLFANNICNLQELCCFNHYKNFQLDYKALILFIILLVLSSKSKKNPLTYLLLGAAFGMILQYKF